jgi:hypothetical protein
MDSEAEGVLISAQDDRKQLGESFIAASMTFNDMTPFRITNRAFVTVFCCDFYTPSWRPRGSVMLHSRIDLELIIEDMDCGLWINDDILCWLRAFSKDSEWT